MSVDLSAGWLFCWADGAGDTRRLAGEGEGKACVNKIRSDSVILRENSMLLLKNIRCFG